MTVQVYNGTLTNAQREFIEPHIQQENEAFIAFRAIEVSPAMNTAEPSLIVTLKDHRYIVISLKSLWEITDKWWNK